MHTHEKGISLMLRERPLPDKGKHTYKGFSSFSLFTEETIKKIIEQNLKRYSEAVLGTLKYPA